MTRGTAVPAPKDTLCCSSPLPVPGPAALAAPGIRLSQPPTVSPRSRTAGPAFPLCIYLEKQPTNPPTPSQDRTNKLYRGNTEGPSPSRTSCHSTIHPCDINLATGPPQSPATRAGGARGSPGQLGQKPPAAFQKGWVQRTDRQMMAQHYCLVPSACPGHEQGGQAAQVLEAKAPGYKGQGQAWGQCWGPQQGGPAAHQGKCWETWGTQASQNKLRE